MIDTPRNSLNFCLMPGKTEEEEMFPSVHPSIPADGSKSNPFFGFNLLCKVIVPSVRAELYTAM